MKVGAKGRRARGEAVGMAERSLIDKWHREKSNDKKDPPRELERSARRGRMAKRSHAHPHHLYDTHHQSLGDRIRESAGAAGKRGGRGGNMGY